MRVIPLAAILLLAACATSRPDPACGCQPDRVSAPPEVQPLPLMDAQAEAALVVRAVDSLCAQRPDPDVGGYPWRARFGANMGLTWRGEDRLAYPRRDSWLTVEGVGPHRSECSITVTGGRERITAVDRALARWSLDQPMTWNIRDRPFGIMRGQHARVRGIADRNEAVLIWNFHLPADDAALVALTARWNPPSG